jgi:hypothetical protein
MKDVNDLIIRAERLLARLENMLPAQAGPVDWNASIGFRWRRKGKHGAIEPVRHVHRIALADLQNIERQKALVQENTRQFVDGLPANNVLLTGARGTGKSSLIKALLNEYAGQGLRLMSGRSPDAPSASSCTATTFRSRPTSPATRRSRSCSTARSRRPRTTASSTRPRTAGTSCPST